MIFVIKMLLYHLPENLTSDTRLFADDAIVYCQMILQNDLVKLAWEQLWGMEFHPQKCSYLKISRGRKPKTYKYILKGVILAEETSTKYLGVDIQSTLTWNNNIDRSKNQTCWASLDITYDRREQKQTLISRC